MCEFIDIDDYGRLVTRLINGPELCDFIRDDEVSRDAKPNLVYATLATYQARPNV